MKVQLFILGVGIPSDQADAIRLAAQAAVSPNDQLEAKVLTVRNWREATSAMSAYTDIAPMLIIPMKSNIAADGFVEFLSLLSQKNWESRSFYVSLGLTPPKQEIVSRIPTSTILRQDVNSRISEPLATEIAERFYLSGTGDEEIPAFTYVPEEDALIDPILEDGLATPFGPNKAVLADADKKLDPVPESNNYVWWIVGGVAVAGIAYLMLKKRRPRVEILRPERRTLPFNPRLLGE